MNKVFEGMFEVGLGRVRGWACPLCGYHRAWTKNICLPCLITQKEYRELVSRTIADDALIVLTDISPEDADSVREYFRQKLLEEPLL